MPFTPCCFVVFVCLFLIGTGDVWIQREAVEACKTDIQRELEEERRRVFEQEVTKMRNYPLSSMPASTHSLCRSQETAVALYDYAGGVRDSELVFTTGEQIAILDKDLTHMSGWWKGERSAAHLLG